MSFENQHPRGSHGRFTDKQNDAPHNALAPDPAAVTAPDGTPMNPGRVTIDGEIVVDAAHVSATRWNGHAVPEFTRKEAEKVVEWANQESDEGPVFEWEGDTLIEIWRDGDEVERSAIEPVYASDGTPLWGVGAMSWVWTEADDS